MYAIVEIAGQQFKVEKEQEIFVHRIEGEKGSAVEFDNVLLLDNDGKVTIGTPSVNGAMIKAKIVEHLKGDKVTVFHKKRRKGYQKENGHRQLLSKIVVEDILAKAPKKAAAKKEEVKKEVKTEAKAPEATSKKSVESKAEATKPKAATKKTAEAIVETTKPKATAKKTTDAKTTTSKPKATPKKEEKEVEKKTPKAAVKKEAKPKAPSKPKAEKEVKPNIEDKKEDTKS